MRQRVRAVASVALQTGEIQIRKIGISTAFFRGDPDLRRRGMIVEFNEQGAGYTERHGT